jgi:outer membrane protein assembly factor BamB
MMEFMPRVFLTTMTLVIGVALGTGAPMDLRAADWPTFGFNNLRQGNNPNETTLGPTNVQNLVAKWSFAAQGAITAQPVLAEGVSVNGTPMDLLFVGDNNGNFFALDANSTNPAGIIIWTRSLGFLQPAPRCLDLPNNHFGIIGSAAISRSADGGALFVAANGRAYAFDLATGNPVSPWPAGGIAIPNVVPTKDGYIYGGVALANGNLYITTASACDHSPYHGQIAEFNAATATFVRQWFTIGGGTTPPPQSGGGIWGPGGVAVDEQPGGGVFAATGNAQPHGQPGESIDFAEDIVKLSLDLSSLLSDANPAIIGSDVDFGATPLLFTATGCAPSVAALAKSGEVFVYWDSNNLINPQRIEIAPGGLEGQLVGIPAWDSATQLLFVTDPADASSGAYKRGLIAFGIQNCQLAKVWQTADVATPPTIANNTYLSPPTAANGVVYFGVGGGYAPNPSGGSSPPNVYAISEQTGQVLWQTTDITGPVLTAPTVVNGQVFVGTFDNKIVAYGLP